MLVRGFKPPFRVSEQYHLTVIRRHIYSTVLDSDPSFHTLRRRLLIQIARIQQILRQFTLPTVPFHILVSPLSYCIVVRCLGFCHAQIDT